MYIDAYIIVPAAAGVRQASARDLLEFKALARKVAERLAPGEIYDEWEVRQTFLFIRGKVNTWRKN